MITSPQIFVSVFEDTACSSYLLPCKNHTTAVWNNTLLLFYSDCESGYKQVLVVSHRCLPATNKGQNHQKAQEERSHTQAQVTADRIQFLSVCWPEATTLSCYMGLSSWLLETQLRRQENQPAREKFYTTWSRMWQTITVTKISWLGASHRSIFKGRGFKRTQIAGQDHQGLFQKPPTLLHCQNDSLSFLGFLAWLPIAVVPMAVVINITIDACTSPQCKWNGVLHETTLYEEPLGLEEDKS